MKQLSKLSTFKVDLLISNENFVIKQNYFSLLLWQQIKGTGNMNSCCTVTLNLLKNIEPVPEGFFFQVLYFLKIIHQPVWHQ